MSEIKTYKCDKCGDIRDDLVTILVRGKDGFGPDWPVFRDEKIRKDFCRSCLGRPLDELLDAGEVDDAIAAFRRRDWPCS